jgi:hypothetical protein
VPRLGGAENTGSALPFAVRQAYYDSVPAVYSSDHKPVVAGFEVAMGRAVLGLRASAGFGEGGDDEGGEAAGGCIGLCSVM